MAKISQVQKNDDDEKVFSQVAEVGSELLKQKQGSKQDELKRKKETIKRRMNNPQSGGN